MEQEPSVFFTFECDGRKVEIDAYIILAVDIGYPQQQDHLTRVSFERSFATQARCVFNHFPVVLLWPEDRDCVIRENGICRYQGVCVMADCHGYPFAPPENNTVEKLIVIWFQKGHKVFPDPSIVPTLQQLPWQRLAKVIDDD